ncbi:hypothetical protein BJ875DRAFT_256512 [Amylocarpus encephaloides]|uniref:Zn(2)-C6 fungal-type domain-containing protein n=1 Tax=Amylocarpus encephaloides TaxID=45428 RepID=A0A9P8C700_9HELO|nr:hypothetical protein BJ875DRAFT_256512 [Amylocarpus encephaloides]
MESRSTCECSLYRSSFELMADVTNGGGQKPPRPHASKACNECKQQKLRCNAKLDPKGCARCQRLGLHCTVENGFKRINKRQKSAILQREVQILRDRLNSVYSQSDSRVSASPSEAMASHSPLSPISGLGSHDTGSQLPRPSTSLTELGDEHIPVITASTSTISRTLDDIVLGPQEIDELFALYFLHYAKHLPFLDFQRSESPNSFYDQSPLLFWAIISAGTRRYLRNPSLLGSLAEPLLKLGWSSMQISGAVIPNIQGLLILSTWPFPTNTTSRDNTFTLSGMAVNLALQIGLHVPLQGQEYSRTRIDLSNDSVARRVQLWSYCVIVHQKAACALGYPITLPLELFQRKMDISGLMRLAPRSLSLEVKLAGIIGRINSVFSEFNFDDIQQQAQVAPSMMLEVFETQFNELELKNSELSELEMLSLQIARLQLRIYYLRCPENDTFPLNLAKLYTTAINIVKAVSYIDTETSNFASFIPHHIYRMMTLATAVVLRVLKTPLASKISEHEAGQAALFLAISLLKKMSVYNNDMPARMVGIFSQLWSSDRAFKPQADASSSTALRIQSRLSMSLLHDTMWWWREEFGVVQNADSKPSKSREQNVDQPDSSKNVPPGFVSDGSQSVAPTDNNLGILNGGTIPDLNLVGPDVPLDGLFLNDDSLSYLWGQVDHGFESMVELFPDSWPL